MKLLSIKLSFICLMFSCCLHAQVDRGHINFIGNDLLMQNDSLAVSLRIQIKANAVRDCQTVVITPELVSQSRHMALPYIRVQGNDKRKMNERAHRLNKKLSLREAPIRTVNVKEDTDITIPYLIHIPFEMWMADAQLVIHQEVNQCDNQIRLFSFTMDKHIRLDMPEPYQVNAQYALTEPKATPKNRSKQEQAFLDFKVGSSILLPDYRRNPEELQKVRVKVCEMQNDPDIIINALYIEGYASPDGKTSSNESLANLRANALRDYIYNSDCLPQGKVTVKGGGEDWEGLKVQLATSDLANKEAIIELIDQTADVEQRKVKMRRLAGARTYGKMLTDIYPQLRRVEYQLDYTVKDYNVAEAKALLGHKEEMLSQREFYLVATSYAKDSKEYQEIMSERILKYHADDAVALSNAGAVLAERAERGTARRYLERAGDLPAALNNLGALLLQEGDFDKARELLTRARKAGVKEAEANLKELETKIQDNLKLERLQRINKR